MAGTKTVYVVLSQRAMDSTDDDRQFAFMAI